MTRRFALLAIWLLVAAVPAAAQERAPLAAMSFNIRYGTANDGENRWALRRDFLIDVMREQAADVVGLQEALDFQIDEIVAALPVYGVIGVGRDDGARKGEYTAILFRRDRFQVSDAGTFWFSDTPEVVASKSWGNSITRICTWARLVDRDGRGVLALQRPSRSPVAALARAERAAAAPAHRRAPFPAGAGRRSPATSTPASRTPPSRR